ncbi:unnamed protein product [Heligmosomoides polygyrus]|uniref:Uncharacterized protein n=1 Tax=Heligmosomoides polygyrus TaxID=6339 RepID=A0A183FGR9_HELPZ|nr:unnamed protein product [Heligmosomoides polygyrus]
MFHAFYVDRNRKKQIEIDRAERGYPNTMACGGLLMDKLVFYYSQTSLDGLGGLFGLDRTRTKHLDSRCPRQLAPSTTVLQAHEWKGHKGKEDGMYCRSAAESRLINPVTLFPPVVRITRYVSGRVDCSIPSLHLESDHQSYIVASPTFF